MITAGPAPGGLRPNPGWARLLIFERRGWKRVRFGDVVENLSETERDPAGAGTERFIGLEHLEPGSLHIRTGAMLRTAPPSPAAAGRGRCSSASAGHTSEKLPWPSPMRWSPVTFMCLHPRMTVFCRRSCRSPSSRSGTSSMRSRPQPARSLLAPLETSCKV